MYVNVLYLLQEQIIRIYRNLCREFRKLVVYQNIITFILISKSCTANLLKILLTSISSQLKLNIFILHGKYFLIMIQTTCYVLRRNFNFIDNFRQILLSLVVLPF